MENKHRNELIEQAIQLLQAGDPEQAHARCKKILIADDKDAEAWSILGIVFLNAGNEDMAYKAQMKAIQLEGHEPRWYIHLGQSYCQMGKFNQAEPVLGHAAKLSNNAIDAVLPWSNCLLELGMAEQAAQVLRSVATTEAPPQIWTNLSTALSAQSDFLGAVSAQENAFQNREMSRDDAVKIINMHIFVGQYDQAQTYVDRLLPVEPNAPDIVLLAANLMRWRGEIDQAHDLLSTTYTSHPDDAQLLLALLELYKQNDGRYISKAKKCIEHGAADLSSRRGLAFVLARLADKEKQFDEAWHYATTANGLYDDNIVSDVPLYRRQLSMGVQLYNHIAASKCDNDGEHLYIIGPPRSGGSLLQTIMAADPGLISVGERGALMAWLLPILTESQSVDAATTNWNNVASDLPLADVAGMRRSYPDATNNVFVDKMPHHAHVAGLLHKLHPNSKFIDVRRNPFDITMSIFLHDFSDKFGYSRSVGDISDYLNFHRKSVDTWQAAGVPIHIHSHDEFLNNPKQGGSDLFKEMALTWKDEYLDPKNRQSTVRTFSALQVRSKVTKAYSGRGQNYKSFMGDAVEGLDKLMN